jgi:pimeloyl-ACP methyl ester carboxylesterase
MTQSTANAQGGATFAPEQRTIRLIHYDISYAVYGAEHGTDGALLLLHDIVGGAFAWEQVVAQLGGLGRAIYVVDMLGYGRSDHPWPADTSLWGHADYLSMFLNDLNLTNIVLVGHGIGGGVAQILATRLSRPRVAALVLIDSVCYQHSFAENWPLPNMKERQDPEAPGHTSLEDLQRDLRATLPAGVYNADRFKKDLLDDYANRWNNEVDKEVLFQHIRELRPYYLNAVASDLKTLEKPTLLIWGQQDEQVPLTYGQRLNREMPGSQLVILPDAGHLSLFDAPDAVASAIGDFLRGAASGA